ncbi:hypothetical protein PVAR5_0497 [Paecilomyces variotii No. 5]|uniref:Uncharacterized protein n=1 Tax=Byssochlamys spectabilis (strain No. 5 / NBRC 109023) TaxID=1356009 RepID=V5F7W1_BYSSN|nr:hypothetical protein PVAR5_0497 [Paecilomyces variotii No. 5]
MERTPRREIAFISGPLETGPDASYFREYYTKRIDAAIARGDEFVIGPIPYGVDADALDYLLAYPISPSRITVFVTPDEDRMWGNNFRCRGVRVTVLKYDPERGTPGPRDRDATMTANSTYDILRWRTRNEAKSFYGKAWRDGHLTNTERNWRRRRGIGEEVIIREEDVDSFMEDNEVQKRKCCFVC